MEERISKKEIEEELAKREGLIQRLTQELEGAKNFTESIIQSIGSGIIITEMNDTITYINRAGERILGYSKDDLMGKPFSIFELREKENVIHSLLDNPDDQDTRREGWMRRKDHSGFPVGFTINNHLSVSGKARALPMSCETLSPVSRRLLRRWVRKCPMTIQEENT